MRLAGFLILAAMIASLAAGVAASLLYLATAASEPFSNDPETLVFIIYMTMILGFLPILAVGAFLTFLARCSAAAGSAWLWLALGLVGGLTFRFFLAPGDHDMKLTLMGLIAGGVAALSFRLVMKAELRAKVSD